MKKIISTFSAFFPLYDQLADEYSRKKSYDFLVVLNRQPYLYRYSYLMTLPTTLRTTLDKLIFLWYKTWSYMLTNWYKGKLFFNRRTLSKILYIDGLMS